MKKIIITLIFFLTVALEINAVNKDKINADRKEKTSATALITVIEAKVHATKKTICAHYVDYPGAPNVRYSPKTTPSTYVPSLPSTRNDVWHIN